MKMFLVTALTLVSGVAALACDNKPTEGKPVAQVSDPVKPAPSAAAAPSVAASAATPAAATSAAVAATPAKGELLAITPENSKVGFTGAKVTGKHQGKFQKFSGALDFIAAKPEDSTVKVAIDLASVKTDQEKLDGHLQSPDFFDVAKFSTATFESTAIKAEKGKKGETHSITGNFDFHGVSKSITFPAEITVKDDKVTAKASFGVDRKTWKIEYAGKADDLIKDEVLIEFDLELPRAKK